MAPVLTFGRAGLATASGGDGLELKCRDWKWRGDTATVKMIVRKQSSLADAKALVAQVLGYDLNSDEPVIPVTWSEDSTVDGFYRVQSVEADAELTGRLGSPTEAGGNTAWELTAELLRVPTSQAPLFEVVCSGAVRSNVHSLAAADVVPWCAIPGHADSYWSPADVGLTPATVDGGTVLVFGDPGETELNSSTVNYRIDPAYYYEGSSRIEVTYDSGSTWRSLTGRQIPNDPDGWRLSNGRVRVSNVSGNMRAGVYDGASWENTDFVFARGANPGAGNQVTDWYGVTVLRNAPEAAQVGVVSGNTVSSAAGGTLSLTIRRGSPVIEAVWASGGAAASQAWSFYRTASETGANVGAYGIVANANDANGNKYQIVSPQTVTQDIVGTSGLYLTSAATSYRFGFSAKNADLVSGSTFAATYFSAMDHRQHIATR